MTDAGINSNATKRTRGPHSSRTRWLCVLAVLVLVCQGLPATHPVAARPRPARQTTPASPGPLPDAGQVSSTIIVFGPQRFDRTAGHTVAVTKQFSLPGKAAAPFTVRVENGASDGSRRVSSAKIR